MLLALALSCCQHSDLYYEDILIGKWKIIDVIDLYLELGVLNPSQSESDIAYTKSLYLNQEFLFNERYFLFPINLKDSVHGYSDTVIFLESKILYRRPDTDESFRYPGTELNCIKEENCFVGESFMRFLKSEAEYLYIIEASGPFPDEYFYKVCLAKDLSTIAIFNESSSLLLILERIE